MKPGSVLLLEEFLTLPWLKLYEDFSAPNRPKVLHSGVLTGVVPAPLQVNMEFCSHLEVTQVVSRCLSHVFFFFSLSSQAKSP